MSMCVGTDLIRTQQIEERGLVIFLIIVSFTGDRHGQKCFKIQNNGLM